MAGSRIEIRSEALVVNARRSAESDGRLRRDEAMTSQWGELPNGDAVERHNEALARVEVAQNFPAVVAQLALRDLSGHI